jgi:hypothetical protein
MRSTRTLLCAALLLAGCARGTVYYAQGVDLATREADFAQCEAQALRDYPVRNQVRFTPRIYVPAERVCNAEGSCVTRRGYFEGGDPYTVDVNAEFRRTATRGCMGTRGYARVGLPFCAPDTAVRFSTVMPPLTDGTCIYRPGGGGASLVVNPI